MELGHGFSYPVCYDSRVAMVRVQLEALPESLQVAVLLSKLADFFLPVGDTEIKNLHTAYVATVPYRFESVNPQTHFSIDTLNKRPSQYMVNECV